MPPVGTFRRDDRLLRSTTAPPLRVCSSGRTPGGPAVVEVSGMPPLVLIAEDEPLLRDVLAEFLLMEGYRVRCAEDGQEALEFFASEVPDVVVSNITMPQVDGITLVHRLREGGHDVPVVLISSNDVALELPGVFLIGKPFDLDLIAGAVRQGLVRPT
jgi:two-component system OmpR family response regulator